MLCYNKHTYPQLPWLQVTVDIILSVLQKLLYVKIIVWVRNSGIVVVLAQISGTDSHAKDTIKKPPPD